LGGGGASGSRGFASGASGGSALASFGSSSFGLAGATMGGGFGRSDSTMSIFTVSYCRAAGARQSSAKKAPWSRSEASVLAGSAGRFKAYCSFSMLMAKREIPAPFTTSMTRTTAPWSAPLSAEMMARASGLAAAASRERSTSSASVRLTPSR
jgi:hypothetical protein